MTLPAPRAGVLEIAPYVGGESDIEGVENIAKLSSNENALGPSPRAVEAFSRLASALHLYPDGAAGELRTAIGEVHGLEPERIVCGSGSDELLSLLAHAYAGPGDEVIYPEHGFAMYPIATRAAGAHPVVAPESDFTTDVDAILAAVTTRTKLVFVANPNNPTGTYISGDELVRLREGLPESVLLVVDAAYAEYVGRNDYADGRELVEAGGNTVMTRTFSKIYGLAALRLGWAYCPPNVVDVLQRVRGPFNVNAAAQAAGVAAIRDAGHVEFSRMHNDRWLPWLTDEVRALGFEVLPSVGNFILVRFPDVEAALAALQSHGVIPRRVAGYGFPDGLRITVGREEDNRAVVAALRTLVS